MISPLLSPPVAVATSRFARRVLSCANRLQTCRISWADSPRQGRCWTLLVRSASSVDSVHITRVQNAAGKLLGASYGLCTLASCAAQSMWEASCRHNNMDRHDLLATVIES